MLSTNRPTIKTIAKEAGVTANTVSQALRDSKLVTVDTKAKILEIARRQGYVPNVLAESLRSGRSRTVALVFGNLGNPLFAMKTQKMEHLLRINAIAGVFGQRVSAWIPTFSNTMTRLLSHRLVRGGELGAEEQAIIDDLVATARTEVGKSRYWKSNELMDLIELSERTRPVG